MPKFAQIIPLKKMPRNIDVFDYKISDKIQKVIKRGSLVKIPFKSKEIFGIVYGFSNTSQFKYLKSIEKIIQTKPYLQNYQLEIANWLSKNYFISKATAINLLVAIPPKNFLQTSKKVIFTKSRKFEIPKNINTLTSNLLDAKKAKKFLIFSFDQEKKLQIILSLMQKITYSNSQLLILTPQKYLINEILTIVPKNLQPKTCVISNELFTSKNRYFETWKKIQSTQFQIIIGTRSAVFAPFSKLSCIFIDYADDNDYKNQEQSPRYDAIEVARKIQSLTNCQLIQSTTSPKVENFYYASREKYLQVALKDNDSLIKVIDLKEEKKKSFTYLSEDLLKVLSKIVSEKKQAILIVNKIGAGSKIICHDCSYQALCPDCDSSLTMTKNTLVCLNCKKTFAPILTCPKCRGTKIRVLGAGQEDIIKRLKNLYPDTNISDNLKNSAQIYVLTNSLNNSTNFKNVGLLAFVYIDSLLYLPDFSSNYKFFQMVHLNIAKLKLFVKTNFDIILQSFFPENFAVQNINSYKNFYHQEIKAREQFNYPPFVDLFKLIYSHHDKIVCQKEAQSLVDILKQQGLQPSLPYLYYKNMVRNRYRIQILLKLYKNEDERFIEVLAKIPIHWTIDNNPLDVL